MTCAVELSDVAEAHLVPRFGRGEEHVGDDADAYVGARAQYDLVALDEGKRHVLGVTITQRFFCTGKAPVVILCELEDMRGTPVVSQVILRRLRCRGVFGK